MILVRKDPVRLPKVSFKMLFVGSNPVRGELHR